MREQGGARPRRILVIANETVAGEALREAIAHEAFDDGAEILVVCPALNTRLKHWVSDVDKAVAAAARRLDVSLAALAEIGINANGRVGDADPVQAIQDALQTFPADEIIISTHPRGRSNWLEKGVVERARDRVDPPITHVVVDLVREQAVPSSSLAPEAARSAPASE